MKNQFLTSLLCILLTAPLFSQTQVEEQLLFDFDSYELTQSHQNQIDEFIKSVSQNSYVEFTIIGHTDQDGSDDYNIELSKKRAQSVKDKLQALILHENLIDIEWKGESELVDANNSTSSKKKNRRVTVQAHILNFENTDDIIKVVHELKPNTFNIDHTQDRQITCNQGTIIDIPANAFTYMDGSDIGDAKVEIEIKEAFTYSDFISEGLFTQSKSDILETGGMIYVNATVNGKPIKFKEGESIEITYPAQNVEEDMELFYASTDDSGRIDWEATNQPITSRTASTFDIEIDWDSFLAFDFNGGEERPYLDFPPLDKKPPLAVKPYPPAKPLKPTLENTPVNVGTLDKVFMSKKKKEALREEKFKEALANYKKQKIKYEADYAKYLENVEIYKVQKPIKDKALADWNKLVTDRIEAIKTYKGQMLRFHVYAQIQGAIKSIKSKVGERTNKQLLNLLNNYMKSPVSLTINEKKLYLKAFKDQTRMILQERKIYPEIVDFATKKNHNLYPAFSNVVKLAKKHAIEEEFEKTGKIDDGSFGSYVTNISTFGWMNCDRYRTYDPRILADVRLKDEGTDTKYYLIFKDMRSMLSGSKGDSEYYFRGLPKRKDVKLVGVKLVDSVPHIAVADYKIQDTNNLEMAFRKASLKEIRSELNSLNALASNL
ncbi:MAG: OmpA family protein [Bacteroidia bacterium]|nr:OmpA family protein [Bacteroidia bacterium]